MKTPFTKRDFYLVYLFTLAVFGLTILVSLTLPISQFLVVVYTWGVLSLSISYAGYILRHMGK